MGLPRPQRVLEVHLDEPLPAVEARGYASACVLVRRRRRPLGVMELDLTGGTVGPEELARQLRAQLGPALDTPDAAPSAPAATPLVSVVVATRERPQLLEACLGSLLAGSYEECEVLVVDNAPQGAATQRVVEEHAGRDPRVRRLVEPRAGAGTARNRGLADAAGEIVAFVDDDVIVDRDWLAATVSGFQLVPDVGCVTALIMPVELETPAQLWLEEFGGFGKGFERRVFDLGEYRLPDRLYPYSAGIFGSGASMAFATGLLRDLGGFDPRLATAGEDLDLFLKVLFADRRIVYEPAALVWHRHPRDYEALRRTMFNYGAGLSGLMTKWSLSRPATAAAIAARIPAAARFALDPRSRKNARKRPDYPSELGRRELTGLVLGPALYLRTAWGARSDQRRVDSTRS